MKISENDFKWMYESAIRNEWRTDMPEEEYYAEGGFYSWLLKKGLQNTLNLNMHHDGVQVMVRPHTYCEVIKYGIKSYNVLNGDKLYNAIMTREYNSNKKL